MAENKQLVATINTLLKEAKGLEGIEVPTREVLPAEFAEQLKVANASIAEHKSQAEAAKAEKAALEAKVAEFTAEKADADRIAKVTVKATKVLEKNAFAKLISAQVEKAAKSDKSFDDTKVDAFVAERTADYQEAEKLSVPEKPTGVTDNVLGKDINEDELNDLEDDEFEEELGIEPAAELNFGRKSKPKK